MAQAVPAKMATLHRAAPPRARDRAGALTLTVLIHAGVLALLVLLKQDPALVAQAEKRMTLIIPTPPEPPQPRPTPREPIPSKVAPDSPKPRLPETPSLPDLAAPAAVAPVVPVLPLPALSGEASAGTSTGRDGRGAGSGNGNGSGGGGEGGDGTGGNVRIVNGRWWRQPSDADFRPPPNLVPGAPRTGWGEIICRTALKYRLVDCVAHKESPAGSGFSKAMVVASRRFRYVAENNKGEPLEGVFVIVHLNFLEPRRF